MRERRWGTGGFGLVRGVVRGLLPRSGWPLLSDACGRYQTPLPVDAPAGCGFGSAGRLGVGNLGFGPFHPLGIRYWNHRVKRSLRIRLGAAAKLGQSLEPPEVTGQIPDASKLRVKIPTRSPQKTRRC
jgi:hypothetical protein